MKKQNNILFPALIAFASLLFTSCAGQQSASPIDGNNSLFQSCRGFDFDKRFPGKENRPFGIHYDRNIKRINNEDGLYFYIFEIRNSQYNKDLELSSQEKKYIAECQLREEAFDRKYAGEIKKKLRSISTVSTMRNGTLGISYPNYLEGDELPEGVATPASYFAPAFISSYISAENRAGDLRDFILSTELYKDATIRDLARSIGRSTGGQIRWRLKSLYTEYILTWYFLKHYDSPQERHRTAVDLAEYYSGVAFRGAAESLFQYSHILTSSQRCRIANYVADRVYYLVMAIDKPKRLDIIKEEYAQPLLENCYFNLYYGRILEKRNKGLISREEAKALAAELKIDVKLGVETCIND